jgi:undecaprenyl diphosphate synthase
MDGNGRWAKQKGAQRIFGHQHAIKSVRDAVEGCAELGVKYLTLYAFSTENWNRPKIEVNALMQLLISTIRKETETLTKNKIRLTTIGNISELPKNCQKELQEAIEMTKNFDTMTLILALSYSGKSEILEAVKKIAYKVKNNTLDPEEITTQTIDENLFTCGIPDPELMIRTSGEIRLSNFLLWQLAYAEFYFTDVLWPDFRKEHLHEAIKSYQNRERRYGKTSEQLTT